MLSLQNKQLNNVFERIVKDKDGILIRVRFTIVEINGVLKGHIISAEPLISKADNTIFCLPCINENIESDIGLCINNSELKHSPYFSLDFFTSQPTRAPSF